jgi:hypothetical protein
MWIPPTIRENAGALKPLLFIWDEWGEQSGAGESDVEERSERISQRAAVLFALGCSAWVIERFRPFFAGQLPYFGLEAAYAQIVDFRYSWDWELDRTWTGPVRGPVRRATSLLVGAIESLRDGNHPAQYCQLLFALALWILPSPDAFLQWSDLILSRLQSDAAIDPIEPIGLMLPFEILDPEQTTELGDSIQKVNQFLANLDVRSNPFLNLPEDMIRDGFPGTPYVFDADLDRKVRVNG